ncbi:hypothetical protein [Runella limosa]|uniref:hypothetical protein n=1 Tax=Runella limosa TaxID=370978 RepID=UPI00041277FE|nr:hypothetical protein [Runella limosa]
MFGTVTDNDTKFPVGNNGILAFQGTKLTTVFTDKEGKYSATIGVPRGYHSLDVRNNFDIRNYRDDILLLNGTKTNLCYPVRISSKTQYDFIMPPK